MSAPIELVRHPRARGLRLSVDPTTGAVRLTMPARFAERRALEWAAEKRDWIAAQRALLPQPRPFVDGAALPFGDTILTIGWHPRAPRAPVREGDRLICGGPIDALSGRVERWLRQEALRTLSEETLAVAARAGVRIDRVAIGDPKARWGSCSSDGVIRYSWRLVCAPAFVRRATVAHEVAHLVHMNHSPAFHALAAELLGEDPRPAHAWLREHGAGLHWLGRES